MRESHPETLRPPGGPLQLITKSPLWACAAFALGAALGVGGTVTLAPFAAVAKEKLGLPGRAAPAARPDETASTKRERPVGLREFLAPIVRSFAPPPRAAA